tara:strand:+ start:1627 stop:1923 length:297 start_codon:yes stop_codon:yes gene_type:complete
LQPILNAIIGDDMTHIELLAQSKPSELLADRDDLVLAINQTLGEIAIGELTDTGYLFEQENNQGYEHAYEQVKDINKALRLQGFAIKETEFANFDALI